MTILGIDPGSRNCGYALLEVEKGSHNIIEAGVIKIKSKDLQEQMLELIESLDSILKDHKIDEVVLEDIFYAHNPQTVLKLAQVRGALMLWLLRGYGIVHEYTPLQVKKALTGKAKADKTQVAFMVKKILGIKKEIKPLDVTDAIAIAITHSQRVRLRK